MEMKQPLESPLVKAFQTSNEQADEEVDPNQPLMTTEDENVAILPTNTIGLDDGPIIKENGKKYKGITEGEKRMQLSIEQTKLLQTIYQEHNIPDAEQRLDLAKVLLNLTPKQVGKWFENKRTRTKVKQNKMDVERLKEENKRLIKEMGDLRALNIEPLHEENERLKKERDNRRARYLVPLQEENKKLKKERDAVIAINLPVLTNFNPTPTFHVVCASCENVRISPPVSSANTLPTLMPINHDIKHKQDIVTTSCRKHN